MTEERAEHLQPGTRTMPHQAATTQGKEEEGTMPRTRKTKPAAVSPSEPEPSAEKAPPGEVLTLAEAAAYLRFSEEEVVRLVEEQGLPARRLAKDWRFLKAAIQQWLSTPPPRGSKEAQRAVIGSWKDDPYLEDMLEEIYRRRGRPITEDGSYRLFHGLSFEKDQE
jgi:excisionase family DNA binding protein